MMISDALEVIVPFGPCHGWPLRAIISKRPAVAAQLVISVGRLYGEVREAVEAIAELPTIQDTVKGLKRERATKARNKRALDAWACR